MLQRSSSRPGITLVEVLAAIFIMGVGLLALLVLFPLGALSMARAVRDDRAAAIAANAAALAVAQDLGNDGNVQPRLSGSTLPFMTVNPNSNAPAPGATGPGYPVLVDPLYAVLLPPPTAGQTALGFVSNVTPGIQRVAPSYATTSADAARWFTFLEEISFKTTGEPKGTKGSPPAGTSVQRPGTYTWTYLVRRPTSGDPNLIEMSVLVYASRSVEVQDGEPVFSVATPFNKPDPPTPMGAAGGTTVTITYPAGAKPNIRRGGWIVDTTFHKSAVDQVQHGMVSSYTYRVESVTDTGATTLTLEVDPPLKANVFTLVFLENVINIADRASLRQP